MKKALIILMSLVLAGSLHARSFGKIYTECGLGGLIGGAISDKTASQLVAIITNLGWDLGTTATSSDITSPSTCQGGKTATALFMLKSYDHLESEIAMGEGDYLNGLLELKPVSKDKLKNITKDIVSLDNYASLTRYQKAQKLFIRLYQ